MHNCVELSNQIKCHNSECEHLKTTINIIEEGSDEKVDNFQNDINALATDVLELNLC
jgi:hypothetical protein